MFLSTFVDDSCLFSKLSALSDFIYFLLTFLVENVFLLVTFAVV